MRARKTPVAELASPCPSCGSTQLTPPSATGRAPDAPAPLGAARGTVVQNVAAGAPTAETGASGSGPSSNCVR